MKKNSKILYHKVIKIKFYDIFYNFFVIFFFWFL